MSSNVCGNCANFKPKAGAKFFDCTVATHEGVKYGMQVRSDTSACDAFSPLRRPLNPQTTTKPAQRQSRPKETEPGRVMLCNWGRVLAIAAIIILIIIIAVVAYTCFSGGTVVTPTPTPTPTPTAPPPTGVTPTPKPTPTPIPVYYYNMGDWAISAPWAIVASKAERVTSYTQPGPVTAPPNTYFIIVTVTVTNAGNSTIYAEATAFTLEDSFGLRFQPRQLPWNFIGAFPYYTTAVARGDTVSGKLIYNVPDLSSGLELRVVVNGQILAWALPW